MQSVVKYIVATAVVAVVAMSVALIASSIKTLSTDEVGIMYDTINRKLGTQVYMAGMHTGPPGYEFIIFPKVYRTASFDNVNCLNKDGLTIQLNVQFQYQASHQFKDLSSLIMEFQDHDTYIIVVKDAAQSVIHDVCSEFNISQFQTSRMLFQTQIKDTLADRLLKEFYTTVGDVQVSDIQRPAQYEQVVRDKETAKQNIEVAKQERPRIITQAETKKKEAETQAEITLREANVQARIVRTKAQSEAEAILNAYRTEAATYLTIKTKQNLTNDGLVSYLTTRAIQTADNPIYVNMDAPAKTSFP